MIKSLTFLLIAAAILTSSTELPIDDNVRILDTESFDEFLTARRYVLVMFVSPEDEATPGVLTEYSRVALKMRENSEDLPVTLVNVENDPKIAKNLDFYTFPKLVLFDEGSSTEYNGKKLTQDIYEWVMLLIMKKRGPELTDLQDVRRVSTLRLALLLKFPESDSYQLGEFLSAQEAEKDIPLFYTYLESVQHNFGLPGQYSMILFRSFDDGKKIMSGENQFTDQTIRQFAGMFKAPMIYPFDREVSDMVFTQNVTLLIHFTQELTPEDKTVFDNFAFKNRHKIKIYQCELKESSCHNFALSIGHDTEETWSVFIVKNIGKGPDRFKFKGGFSDENLSRYVDDFHNGLLNVYFKSEKEPQDNSGPVLKAVRSSFNRLVLKVPKTVILLGYAPNNESLEYEFIVEKYAKRFSYLTTVSFVKIDVSKNEHDSFYVTKVPQLFVYKKNHKSNPSVFLGKTDEDEVFEFLDSAIKEEVDAYNVANKKRTEEL